VDGFEPFDEGAAGLVKNNAAKKFSKKNKKRLWKKDVEDEKEHNGFAKTACKWITVHNFASTKACVAELRREGFDIWATDLGQAAVPLGPGGACPEVPDKLAVVFGTEATGCTDEMLGAADLRVYLPLTGFADSLNLSVAAAMVVQRILYMDPALAGAMPEGERAGLRGRWYEALARSPEEAAKYRGMLERGEVVEPFRDPRRAGEHRGGWMDKKIQRKTKERYERLEREGDK
jgi:tRNA(Leu) C34 or U34 (ribose-2'-O)-methylase TrmL